MFTLELTEEELEFLYTRCQRKAMRLEEAHLKDIPCYRLAYQIIHKIHRCRKTHDSGFIDTAIAAKNEGKPLTNYCWVGGRPTT